MTPMTILYHASCADGFTAAWLLNRTFENSKEPDNISCIPVQYGEAPPLDTLTGHNVVVVDFSYPTDALNALCDTASSLVVLDHHESARATLEGFAAARLRHIRPNGSPVMTAPPYIVFDITKSGARLAWEWVRPDRKSSAPLLIQLVEDRDLWRFDLPNSKVLNAAIGSYEMTFENWDDLDKRLDPHYRVEYSHLLAEGTALLRAQDRIIRQQAARARAEWVGGHFVLVANATTCISETGQALAETQPFGVTYQDIGYKRVWSLRSLPHGVDVAKIAEGYGGGGHPNAAGFTTLLKETSL